MRSSAMGKEFVDRGTQKKTVAAWTDVDEGGGGEGGCESR